MGNIDFRGNMRRYPTQEIVRIAYLGEEEELAPEAIAAAKAELLDRGITDVDAIEILGELITTRAEETPRDQMEMGVASRIFFIVFALFLLIPAMICAVVLGTTGYKRKSQQAWLSISVSVVILLLFVIAILFF